MLTLVVAICMSGSICHDEIVTKMEMSPVQCFMMAQRIIADWKEHSQYKGVEWAVKEFRCEPGDYKLKDAI
jgi:hypothetical protein